MFYICPTARLNVRGKSFLEVPVDPSPRVSFQMSQEGNAANNTIHNPACYLDLVQCRP